MDREISGMYFRIERNDKRCNVCFEDMTEEEMNLILNQAKPEFVKGIAKGMAKKLKQVCDDLDILSQSPEEDDEI